MAKPKRKHSMCSRCGTNKTCQVCDGSGHWATKPGIKCSHCRGRGKCPVNK